MKQNLATSNYNQLIQLHQAAYCVFEDYADEVLSQNVRVYVVEQAIFHLKCIDEIKGVSPSWANLTVGFTKHTAAYNFMRNLMSRMIALQADLAVIAAIIKINTYLANRCTVQLSQIKNNAKLKTVVLTHITDLDRVNALFDGLTHGYLSNEDSSFL